MQDIHSSARRIFNGIAVATANIQRIRWTNRTVSWSDHQQASTPEVVTPEEFS